MAGTFSTDLRKLLWGTPWGEVFPPKQNPEALAVDGRTSALRTLRQYLTGLTFFRSGGVGQAPIPFKIDPANFHIEWPDYTADMVFPSIAIVHGPAKYDIIGLASYIEEASRDVYQPGTVLQWQSEYIETFNLEIWASKIAERRAIISGLEVAFSPTEQMSGVRFVMPTYFNELVCFVLNGRQILDEPDTAPRNRRRARMEIEMRFNVVSLVNSVDLNTYIKTDVDVDMDTGLEIAIDPSTDPGAVVLDEP